VPPAPPYALAPIDFRFRALAALAGRAPLGGEREVSLAALMAARLVSAALPPDALSREVRLGRASGARAWFSSLTLQAAFRVPLARLIDATASDDLATISTTFGALTELAAPYLDAAAQQELAELARVAGREAARLRR
jgi:hypothetical protein